MAVLAFTNLGFVLFDLSYIPLRNLYLREVPRLTQLYDPVKAIEPHRDTQRYLDTVEQLKAQVAQTGLASPQVDPLLQQLRDLSVDMIENNPFEVARKSGTLEKIKNKLRRRVGDESSKQSFNTFWSKPYLLEKGWSKEIGFYNQEIQPLIATNYFRPIGETGEFINYFWKIDAWFNLLFAIEFLARTYYIHRRHTGLRWLDAMLWRWYDIFLLIPFSFILLPVWTLLRVIPVTIRLHQADLIRLDRIQAQVNQGLVANFAEELTEVVVIRVINQLQDSIRKGDITRFLSGRVSRPYIDLNNVNETEAIANLLVKLAVYQVLPKIQPDLEALLRHSLEKILDQNPIYRNLQQVPGLGQIPTQLIEGLVHEVSQSGYKALTDALEDPVGADLTNRLVQHFSEAMGSEVQRQHTLQTIQSLLSDLLEEIKLNYVQRLSEQDVEAILEQTRQIRTITKR